MSNNSGNTRASIPSSLRKTIQNIKEIGVNHSEEDVYAILKECNMDPNETVQRLLFMDTFHEVKRKRDKRKETGNGTVYEDSRRKPSNQGRGATSGRGSLFSQYASHDAGGGRNTTVHKENGLDASREKRVKPPAPPVLKEVDSRTSTLIEKMPPTTVNGHPTGLPNDDVNVGYVGQNSESVSTVLQKDLTDAGPIREESTLSQSLVNTEHAPSASVPVPVSMQSCDTQLPTALGATKVQNGSRRSLQIAVEMKDSVTNERHLGGSCELIDQTQLQSEHGSDMVDVSKASSSRNDNSEQVNIVKSEINQELSGSEKISSSPIADNASAVNSSLLNAEGPTKAIEESVSKLEKLKFSVGQQVILPNHIQVPDAVKNVLSFGSLDSCFGVGGKDIKTSESNGESNQASEELLEDETAKKPESCDEDTPSSAQEENYPDPPSASVTEMISTPENLPEDDERKQETLPAVGPPYPAVQTPAYGFIPSMMGSPLIQFENNDHRHQACLSNSMNGNLLAMSTSAPTQPPSHSPGAVQSSVVVSVQPVPLLRQPYPPNIIPYAHYLSPFFVSPTFQFVGHGGFPPQLPTGNICMPAGAATAPGMKMSPPYKPGTNISNQAPIVMPSTAYGVYSSPQVGYSPSTDVTSGSSNANEDLVPSVLKENNVYIGQQSEGSAVWIPAPGHDPTNLSINSFFNLAPQRQHLPITPQPGHGAFATAFHPLQTLAAPAAATHPLLQQSQSMAGPAEPMGPLPPPNAFPQTPQRHQINWNTSF